MTATRGGVDDRTLEREPVGQAGQSVVASLALDALVQHALDEDWP